MEEEQTIKNYEITTKKDIYKHAKLVKFKDSGFGIRLKRNIFSLTACYLVIRESSYIDSNVIPEMDSYDNLNISYINRYASANLITVRRAYSNYKKACEDFMEDLRKPFITVIGTPEK